MCFCHHAGIVKVLCLSVMYPACECHASSCVPSLLPSSISIHYTPTVCFSFSVTLCSVHTLYCMGAALYVVEVFFNDTLYALSGRGIPHLHRTRIRFVSCTCTFSHTTWECRASSCVPSLLLHLIVTHYAPVLVRHAKFIVFENMHYVVHTRSSTQSAYTSV